jgi:hypothetical protein
MENELWYMVNAPTGAHQVSSTVVGATDARKYEILSLCGVDQTTPIEATSTWTGAGTTSSITITPGAATSWIVDNINKFGVSSTIPGASQTLLVQENAASTAIGGSYVAATSTNTMLLNWTWTVINDSEQIAASIKAAATAAAATRRRMPIITYCE